MSGWEDTWKLILIQLGGNDICVSSCDGGGAEYAGDATPDGWYSNMKAALTILKSDLDKTLVVFTSPYDPTKLGDVANKPLACQFIFPTMCPCLSSSSHIGLRDQYQQKLEQLAAEMRWKFSGIAQWLILYSLFQIR